MTLAPLPAMASHAARPHRRFVQQPVLALLVGALIAVLLGLPFLSVAPNRLATGQGVPLVALLSGAWWGLLAPLFASLDGPTLQRLNAQIALEGQDARKVAEAHLKAKGLIP